MNRILPCVAVLCSFAVAADTQPASKPAALIEYGPGRELCKLADPAITESSGLAVSRTIRNAFWTHNDSGDKPRLFAIDTSGKTVVTMTIEGANSVDWEDICSYIDFGKPTLLIGDIGDNPAARKTCTIYAVREPHIYPGATGATVKLSPAETIEFSYEGGPTNCESLAIDPTSRTIYMVAKGSTTTAACKIFELPWPAKDRKGNRVDKGPYTAKIVGTVPRYMITGMDISSDGLRCVMCTYGSGLQYVRAPGETWPQAFARGGKEIDLPQRVQGEGICFGLDARTLYLTSETKKQGPSPLLEIPPTAAFAIKTATLTVYNTGDIHEHTGNLARAAQYVRAVKKLDGNCLFLDAGDLTGGGGESEVAKTKGEGMWSLMAAAGYDAGVLGNHDYNKGMTRIEELCRKHPGFPLLMANAAWSAEQKSRGLPALLPPSKIVKLADLTVGIVGIGSHDMRYAAEPRVPATYGSAMVRDVAGQLRKQGCDLVVAVTHQYEDDDYWKTATGPNAPDLIVGGHSHGGYAQPYGYGAIKPSFIVKAGPYIKVIGAVQIVYDLTNHAIIERSGDIVYVANFWPEAEDVKALREKIFKK
ncbi:MAG: metallophosphoesterase [Planctomycetaceae bacterium]|nr:metallophosphoesterase [Planctomycetaceae bacterium]